MRGARARHLSRHEVRVEPPFRLDLTVSALRRLPTNVVDVLLPDGAYARALRDDHGLVVVRASVARPDALEVTVDGPRAAHAAAVATVRRVLGVERDTTGFERAAAGMPWLRPLVRRMRGLRPPRYPTLWEACVNAIAFQQLSVFAASAIVARLVTALGTRTKIGEVPLWTFPDPESWLAQRTPALRAMGLTMTKLGALRRAAEAIASGALDERTFEALPSADAAARLRRIKGIGPWTAAVILLRGLGRLDVFPPADSSVAHNLARVAGDTRPDIASVVRKLEPQQGMLYFYLLLARLEARGVLPVDGARRYRAPLAGGVAE